MTTRGRVRQAERAIRKKGRGEPVHITVELKKDGDPYTFDGQEITKEEHDKLVREGRIIQVGVEET